MSRASDAANGLMAAVGDVCGLWGVPLFRMNSRTVSVVGAGGRTRPMFFGQWTDDLGVVRRKGMADILTMPRITYSTRLGDSPLMLQAFPHTVPLWIECKVGAGRMTEDQQCFKQYVENAGAYHLSLHDSADELILWLETHGAKKR